MEEVNWNEKAKLLLKSELIRNGVSHDCLVELLHKIGVVETKGGIDSKISRGTFSAAFLIQCLNAIGCKNLQTQVASHLISEPAEIYNIIENSKNKKKKK